MDHVKFSPTDPQYLISISYDKVWHWNIDGQQANPTHNGSYIASSLDGTQFVLICGEDILVRNTSSRQIVAKFHMADDKTRNCCFSPDGRLIAATVGQIAYVWDTTSSHPHPIETLHGHSDTISFLTFSSPSSLISSSWDNSVKFWEIGTLQADPVVADPESTSFTSAKIVCITLQAEDGIAISSDSDGVVRTWDVSTGLCMTSFQTPAKNPEQSHVQLINRRLIFVWYADKKIHIQDVKKGKLLHTVRVTFHYNETVREVRISGDGSIVFCQHWKFIQALSILTGKVVGKVGIENCSGEISMAVDGLRVWVHSTESEPLGWDFGTPGSPPVQLSSSPPPFPSHAKLWDIRQSRIKDAATGRVIFRLAGRFAKPVKSQWDGRYLVTGYNFGEVLILDFIHVCS